MSLLGWAAGAFVVSKIIKNEKKRKQATQAFLMSNEYENDNEEEYEYECKHACTPCMPCQFEEGFSEEEFEAVVKREARRIRRIQFTEEYGGMVKCRVQSQSGISDWEFYIDFNDAGHITGAYSISSENTESAIPSRLAENITNAIQSLIARDNSQGTNSPRNKDFGLYCPYCGEFTPGYNVEFCFYCGKQKI